MSHRYPVSVLLAGLTLAGALACASDPGSSTVIEKSESSDARVPDPVDASPEDPSGCPAGAPQPLTRVRFLPAPGAAARMLGGTFQGSNLSPTNGFVVLATIVEQPDENEYTELVIPNQQTFRYLKYYAPPDSYGNVAELEFFHGAQTLIGTPFGTAGSREAGEGGFGLALDGKPETFFDGEMPSENYVGVDIGREATVQAPVFSPAAGHFESTPMVSISSGTPGAQIRYTTDGSNPTADHGELWTAPIPLQDGQTQIKAIAHAQCLFASEVVSQTYTVGAVQRAALAGQKSYHIGNSLTDTINPWLEPIADSTGVDHVYSRWTIPGAPIRWLWEHKREGFADPAGANDFDNFVKTFAPIDHMSLQPFSDSTFSTQAADARKMFTAARVYSPNLQLWIYAQWPSVTEWPKDGLSLGAEWDAPASEFPAAPKNWEEATLNQIRYHERFRKYVDDGVEGKTVLVVPSGLALLALKRAVDAGSIPGIRNFFAEHFSDDLHLSTKGAYLVGLVFYACLYQASPKGRVTSAGSGLTDEQARIYQQIAWDTVRGYAWSGVP